MGAQGCTWERRQKVWKRQRQASEHLEAPTTSMGAPGSADDKSASTSNHSRAVRENQLHLWARGWCAWKSQLLLIIQ
jgi:hypothetical protein